MSFGSHESISSLTPKFVKAVVQAEGGIDNFVDHQGPSFVGMPDLDTDPQAREIDRKLTEQLDSLVPRMPKRA